MKTLKINPDIGKLSELKHFSWDDIAKFSDVDRKDVQYRQGAKGDWKTSSEGADGYFLITVGGQPYWADAIGQIPFAVDYYKDLLQKSNKVESHIRKVISQGIKFGEGKIIGGSADKSNTYDTYFILRGALYAYHKYKSNWEDGGYKIEKTNYSSSNLKTSITDHYKNKYLTELRTTE